MIVQGRRECVVAGMLVRRRASIYFFDCAHAPLVRTAQHICEVNLLRTTSASALRNVLLHGAASMAGTTRGLRRLRPL